MYHGLYAPLLRSERQGRLKEKLCNAFWFVCNLLFVMAFAFFLAAFAEKILGPSSSKMSEQPLSESIGTSKAFFPPLVKRLFLVNIIFSKMRAVTFSLNMIKELLRNLMMITTFFSEGSFSSCFCLNLIKNISLDKY